MAASPDSRTLPRRALPVAVAALLVGGTATAAVVTGAGVPPAAVPAAAAAPATTANEADLAFLRAMIVHHAQAVEISELVASRSDRPQLVEFAEGVIDAQEYEIGWMQQLLAMEGEPPVDLDGHHHHHDMPGMLSPAEVEAMRTARGAVFDERFVRGMIFHHEGAVVMAEEVLDEGQSLAVAHLAVDVLEQQEPEIAVLRRWLDDWT